MSKTSTKIADPQGKIEQCVAALRRRLPICEVWLFGSCAEGKATADSDIDILAVLDDDHGLPRPGLAAASAISDQRAKLRTDVLVLTTSQWEREQTEPFGIYEDILTRGKRSMRSDPRNAADWLRMAQEDLERGGRVLLPFPFGENS